MVVSKYHINLTANFFEYRKIITASIDNLRLTVLTKLERDVAEMSHLAGIKNLLRYTSRRS